ncbi:MAG: hypothetical protein ACJAYU_004023 [Bradymonadia bacterium]|jgi:hypothetical protein
MTAKKKKAKFRSELTPAGVRDLLGGDGASSLLRALGLTTERGGASADSHRKLKQLTHFVRLIEPALREILERYDEPVIVDAAAGKGYLGLVLAQLILKPAGKGALIGIESREELAERVQAIANKQSLPATLLSSSIQEAELPERVHFLLALHACDTATDEAIVRGINAKADYIAVVPCCQAEVSRLIAQLGDTAPVSAMWRHAWHRREFGAQLTNVIRALALEARGYQVTVTELAGLEHSLKNELILARRVGRYHAESAAKLDALLAEIPVKPWLIEALPPVETPADNG